MSHMTQKKKRMRDKNNKLRVITNMNTGTRDMGFSSNQDRKAYLHGQIRKGDLYEV